MKQRSNVIVTQYTKPKIKHHFNKCLFPDENNNTTGVSMTEPDMAFSLEEIILRSTRGLSAIDEKVPLYQEGTDEEIMRSITGFQPGMDLADMEALAAAHEQAAADAKAKLKAKARRLKERQQKEVADKLLGKDVQKSVDPQKVDSGQKGANEG